MLVGSAAGSSGSIAVTGWTTFGNGLGRGGTASAAVRAGVGNSWGVKLRGHITSQPIVVRGAPGTRRATVYFATSAGVVAAFSDTGRQLWRVQVGKLEHVCKQLPGYGVTGTPVADPVTHSLYFVDGVGRLHGLALETGKERPGWPVRLYTDFRQELVWGALTAIRGSIYLGTGSYCDAPMVGKIFRVNTRTRDVSHWDVVPEERGGGGGVWGWGGIAYSSARQSLLAVTGNAFRGGSNDGDSFREWEPYGEHLVELSLSLQVRAASHPAGPHRAERSRLRRLTRRRQPSRLPRAGHRAEQERPALRVEDEDDRGRARVDAAARSLEPACTGHPGRVLGRPARALRRHAERAGQDRVSARVAPGKVQWKRKQGVIQSTPTVAGSIVWQVGWHSGAVLIGIDGRSGRVRERHALGKDLYYIGPAILDGKMYLGSFGGLVRALQ